MITARFRARLPPDTWAADVSERHPEATLRLLSGVRRDDHAVELGEAVADRPEAVGRDVADHPSIVAYDRLEATDRRVLAKYESRDTGLYEFVAGSSLPIEYPVVVQNGWYELDITGTRAEFDRLRSAFEGSGREFELLSVVTAEETTDLLTARQREVLDAALRRGYFEIPRECTLDELATDLDVDKSTASRILRRGSTRVLRWYLTGSERDPDSQRRSD